MDLQGGLNQAWNSIATFVPRFLAFLVILLIGWLIAKAIAKGLDMVLRRVGLEKVADRAGLNRFFQSGDWDTTKLISKVVYYALLLVVLQAAFGVFGPNPISSVLTSIVNWIPRGVVAIVIVVVTAAIANVVRDLLSGALSSVSSGRVLANVAWGAIVGLGAIAALDQMGVAGFVTRSLLTAVLVTVVGVLVIGMGGGLIRPMQGRWEGWMNRIERESKQAGLVPRAREASDRPMGAQTGEPESEPASATTATTATTAGTPGTTGMTGGTAGSGGTTGGWSGGPEPAR